VGAEPSGCDSDAKIDLWQQAAILAPGTLLASSRSVMREIVVQRKMSRWPADPAVGEFTNDARLSDEDISTIDAWVKGRTKQREARDWSSVSVLTPGWLFPARPRTIQTF